MKTIIERIIKLRNPNFNFDENLTSFSLLQFLIIQAFSLLRGIKFLLYLKNPKGAILGKRVKLFNVPKIHYGKFLKLGNDVSISAL